MKAVLVGIDWEKETVMHQFADGDNPVLSLRGLQASIEDDWPTHVWAIYGDEPAMEAWADYAVPRLLGEVDDE